MVGVEDTTGNIFEKEKELERKPGESYLAYFKRWKLLYHQLSIFYNSKLVKKRQFDHKLALNREKSLGLKAVLKMANRKPNEISDGSVVFSFGDCKMGKVGNVGVYAGFQTYLVKHLRQLGYSCIFDSEYFTSQKFPISGHLTEFSGMNMMRIKYCRELDIYIHRDLMAAENMCDILACKLLGLERPDYLIPVNLITRQPVRL